MTGDGSGKKESVCMYIMICPEWHSHLIPLCVPLLVVMKLLFPFLCLKEERFSIGAAQVSDQDYHLLFGKGVSYTLVRLWLYS